MHKCARLQWMTQAFITQMNWNFSSILTNECLLARAVSLSPQCRPSSWWCQISYCIAVRLVQVDRSDRGGSRFSWSIQCYHDIIIERGKGTWEQWMVRGRVRTDEKTKKGMWTVLYAIHAWLHLYIWIGKTTSVTQYHCTCRKGSPKERGTSICMPLWVQWLKWLLNQHNYRQSDKWHTNHCISIYSWQLAPTALPTC